MGPEPEKMEVGSWTEKNVYEEIPRREQWGLSVETLDLKEVTVWLPTRKLGKQLQEIFHRCGICARPVSRGN